MKRLVKFSGISVALLFLITACEKDETNETNVEGIYKGFLNGLQTKSTENRNIKCQ